jgi:hypothetical protein
MAGVLLILSGCEKWYTTEDVSHVSYIPEFVIEGGEFISLLRSDTMEYADPGATATSNGEPLHVYAFGEVDVSKTGVYIIRYLAENGDGLIGEADRIVAVVHHDVSYNDLSGTYEGTNWDLVESKVRKIDTMGLYECDEVLGYYNLKMPGRFVDLGNDELVLLAGEGYLGRYAASEGTYTRSTLSWTIILLDPPNDGIEIDVLWRKKD